jgi:hypothetical protein
MKVLPLSGNYQAVVGENPYAAALMNEVKNFDHKIKQAVRKVKAADDEAEDARLDASVTS